MRRRPPAPRLAHLLCSLKEIPVEIPSQSAITLDNVTLHLDAVLYLKIVDPFRYARTRGTSAMVVAKGPMQRVVWR